MGGIIDSIFGGGGSSATEAAQIQQLGISEGNEEQRRQFDISQEQLAPFREAGIDALRQQQALLGLQGAEQQQTALDAFSESPGQKFLRERGERALLRNSAAIGGIGGGNIRSALQEQGIGVAATQLGEFQNRLSALSGTGQTATAQGAKLGSNTATNIQQGLQAGGQAGASGILGAQQARGAISQQLLGTGIGALAGSGALGATAAGAFGGGAGAGALIGLLSDIRLKTNIVKTGELESGLAWYTWDWTDEGLELAGKQIAEGVLAHEAQEKFPNAVNELNGVLRVNYERIH